MADHPFNEVVKTAEGLIKKGVNTFQKFTCDGCGVRQTIDVPNVFYTSGKCEECGHVTDIRAKGCNYLATAGPENGANLALLDEMLKRDGGELK